MKLVNASIPRLDHVRHYRDAGYFVKDKNTITLVTTPFTVVSHFDRETMKVQYKVSFCSPKEKQFVKKVGIQKALESEKTYEVQLDFDKGDKVSYMDIEEAILENLICSNDDVPNAHRKAFDFLEQQSDIF